MPFLSCYKTSYNLTVIDVCCFQAQQDLTENLVMMKSILCGSEQHEPQPEIVEQIFEEVYNHNLIFIIVDNISYVDLEVVHNVLLKNLMRS